MSCSLPHTVEQIQAYVHKQCDEDDVARQEAIMGRRALLKKKLDDEARKDYDVKKTLWTFVDAENVLVDYEIQVMDDVLVDPDAEENFVTVGDSMSTTRPTLYRHIGDT
ncbi:hypothetical protein Tco_1381286 [Tanacetum coccineum]